MANVGIPGIHVVPAKNGRTYVYAWRGGPAILARPIGSPAFLAELADHLAARDAHKRPDPTRIHGLVVEYRASPAFLNLADSTKAQWLPWLDRIRDHFGKYRVTGFGDPRCRKVIKQWRDQWKDNPRTADYGMQVLSRVLSVAVENGDIATNPCEGIANLYKPPDRSEIIWGPDDLADLKLVAPDRIYLAARLTALTGLRRGDLLRLSWSHIDGREIRIPTSKSNRRLAARIPIYGDLRALLDTIPKLATTVLVNEDNHPWHQNGFSSAWQRAMSNLAKHRGVKKKHLNLHFHDLRGTAATRFYLAGFHEREIAAMLAWKEDQVQRIIDRYVRRDAILDDRIRRLDENGSGTDSVKSPVKLAVDNSLSHGAGDGNRTHDIQLGKLTFYL